MTENVRKEIATSDINGDVEVINGNVDESKFKKFQKIPIVIEAYQTEEEIEIKTLEGVMMANKGDWIIKGIKGELYPCKPDVFEMTYEKVNNDGDV